jgi:hypothetical protein
MSEQDHCPIGSQDCSFGGGQDVALTAKIMLLIERHRKEEGISQCPRCLCDTMLAVAALLQLEAVRLDSANRGKPLIKGKSFDEQFAEAARDRMQAVIEAVVGNVVPFSNNEGRYGNPRQPGRG